MALGLGLRRRAKAVKGWWLYILPLPLAFDAVFSLWSGEIGAMATAAAAYAMFLFGADIARRGFARDAERRGRAFARVVPYKATAAGTFGLATAFAAFAAAGHDIVTSAAFGVACVIGFFLVYGFDPKRAQPSVPADIGVSADEIRAALGEAYAKVDGIETAGKAIGSLEFRERLGRIVGGAQKILSAIEENPRELRRARRFINVYLDGARQVTEKYARTHTQADSPLLEQNFRRLLIDMETVCEEQYQKLTDNSVSDLDVQIEVLTTRLKREGVG